MSDYSENLDFSPSRKAKIAACEKLRDTVTDISPLHKSLLDESLASSPSHRNSFSEIYRMSTQAMAMKKEEMEVTKKLQSLAVFVDEDNVKRAKTLVKLQFEISCSLGQTTARKSTCQLGRVIDVIPGKNGIVRHIKIQTSHSKLLSPVQHVYALEILVDNDFLPPMKVDCNEYSDDKEPYLNVKDSLFKIR
ncbi:hypothetical protein TNIN_286321 [Trichonephila inaurata madagascariensis]|uniref:DUF5641 domain-containing protein n=1 Tax=Trichonephila inaurata madagascariensis TaxID=2747483 RepID=A0A8X7BZL8_9ARAC|nr:hypothetical protein TNIN_286321 [Trichonephila inaurata madagascariensis]